MNDKKYFAVTAKCGHVGKGNYMPITFAVIADSGKEAAEMVRKMPRVKHDHKDAIRDVRKIEFEEFKEINDNNKKDNYLKCTSKQEQKSICIDLDDRLVKEQRKNSKEYSYEERAQKIKFKMKKQEIEMELYEAMDELAYTFI